MAMTVLPGGAESACFIHRYKPLGDNRVLWEYRHTAHSNRTVDSFGTVLAVWIVVDYRGVVVALVCSYLYL